MNLTLDQLQETTEMTIDEIDEAGIPLTCPNCPGELAYTPTTTEVMIDCGGCAYNDVCRPKQKIRLYS